MTIKVKLIDVSVEYRYLLLVNVRKEIGLALLSA